MKRLICLALLLPITAWGGKKKEKAPDPEHANHFLEVLPVGGDVKVGVSDAWARDAEAKLKVVVQNDTADFVVFDVNDMRVRLGGGEFMPGTGLRGAFAVVEPRTSANRVLSVTGSGMHAESGEVVVAGVARVAAEAPTVLAEDLKLPLEKPGVKAGPFDCVVPEGKIKKETDETIVRFKCRYEGTGLGLVKPAMVQIRTEDGQLFANEVRDLDPRVVRPGEEFKFDVVAHISAKVVDMQFAPLFLVWNDTFRDGQPTPVDVAPIGLVFDPAMTGAKN
jgi:hypothetical protein